MGVLSRLLRRAGTASASSRAVAAASANWPDDPRTASATSDVAASRALVGQRVAGLFLNDAVVRSAVHLLGSQIVGTGVMLNCGDAEVDSAFNYARLDPSRRQSITAMQQSAVRSWAILGEILGLHLVLDGQYAFQLLHPEQLDASKNEDLGAGARIVSGVEIDRYDRVSAYWILPQAPGDPFATETESVRFEARNVVHLFEADFPGQVRGISPLAAVVPVLNTASVAVDAMVKRLQASAMFVGFITSTDGEDAFEADRNPTMEPGAILRLRSGETFESAQGGEAGDLGPFLKVLYRQVAAAIGVTYEDLIGDLEGVNYSSYRAGALTARRKAEVRRWDILVEGFLEPVFDRWLAVERLAARISAEVKASWIEPSWPQIDPAKEIEAEIAALNAGLKSRHEIIKASGRDPEKVLAEIEADPRPTTTAPQLAPQPLPTQIDAAEQEPSA